MTARFLSKMFAPAAMSLALMAAVSAHAATYELTFTGTDVSGDIYATTNAANAITSIAGWVADTDLSPSFFSITGSSGYAGADNALLGMPSYVTFAGLSFSTAVGTGYDFNLYDNGGGNYALLSQFINAGGNPADGMTAINMSVTSVPEPGKLTLLIAGALGLWGVTRRRAAR